MRTKKANSFCEWVVGANYVSRKKVSSRRTVANLTWQTDDNTDTDTISLSVPRGRRLTQASHNKKQKNKQVHFADSTQDAKEVSEDPSTDQSGDDTEDDVDSDCPCGKCTSARIKPKKQKHGNETPESEDSQSDAVIHAKHKDKKAQKTAAKKKANGNHGNNKSKRHGKTTDNSDADSDTVVDSTASENEGKHNRQSNSNNKKGKGGTKKQAQKSGAESDQDEETDEEPSKARGKNKGKDEPKGGRKKKNKGGDPQKMNENSRGSKSTLVQVIDESASTKEKVKKQKRIPQPPPRRPELLMPVNAQVLQVEHAVECADDPHPNAFYDAEHGIMRVYHGGAYGNPYGALYPKRWSQNMPLGVPHPSQNPWMYGFAPASHAPAPPLTSFVPPNAGQRPGPGNPWFQGQYTMQVPGPITPKSKDPRAAYNESPSLRPAAKRENNVGPCAPPGSPTGSNILKRPGDIQGVPGSKDEATNGNPGVVTDPADKIWSPQDSKKLEEALNNARKSNSKAGSKASSKKNDDIWGNNGVGSWGDNGNINNASQMNDNGWGAGDNNQNNTTNWAGNVNQECNIAGGDTWKASNDNAWNDSNNNNDNNGNNTAGNDLWINNNIGNTNSDNQNNNNNTAGGDGWNEPIKGSPSNKPPSTGGNVGPGVTGIADKSNEKSPRSNNSNGPMPGAWPPSGGNVFGGSGQGSNPGTQNSPSQIPPASAGNVAGNMDWGNANVANETGGYWNTEQGKADEKMTQEPPRVIHW